MRQYSSYLFDFDGTLTATLPLWFEAISKTLVAQNTSLSDHDIAAHLLGGWASDRVDGLSHIGITDAVEFSDSVNEMIKDSNLHEALLHSGAETILHVLKKKHRYRALVTNNFQVNVDRALLHHQLNDMFDVVVTRDNVMRVKPDPEMVRLALAGRDPGDAVMIGDTAHDVAAAKAAGVTAIVYFPKENERYYSYSYIKSFGADRIIRTFDELIA